jgi:hypothetical protein
MILSSQNLNQIGTKAYHSFSSTKVHIHRLQQEQNITKVVQ